MTASMFSRSMWTAKDSYTRGEIKSIGVRWLKSEMLMLQTKKEKKRDVSDKGIQFRIKTNFIGGPC